MVEVLLIAVAVLLAVALAVAALVLLGAALARLLLAEHPETYLSDPAVRRRLLVQP